MTELIIDGVSYEIVMYGFVFDNKVLIEMLNITKDEAEDVLTNCNNIIFVNSDGVKTDYSKMRFDSFLDDEKVMVLLA